MKKVVLFFVFAVMTAIFISCAKDPLIDPNGNEPSPDPTEEATVTFNIYAYLDNSEVEYSSKHIYIYVCCRDFGDTLGVSYIIDRGFPLVLDTLNTVVIKGDVAEKLLATEYSIFVSVVVPMSYHGSFVNTRYEPEQVRELTNIKKVTELSWHVSPYLGE